jgi:hypothetical protein
MSKLRKIIKNTLPHGIGLKIQENRTKKLPKICINDRHVTNAKLVTNRESILNLLPKNSVGAELGVGSGDFSEDILEICNPKKLELIDVWNSRRFGQNEFELVSERFSTEIEKKQVSITRKLSVEAAETFENAYFDWVYIDTDHSYSTTIQELYAYKDKVKDSGYIAGHDYVIGNWNKGYKYGVIEAVAEFCVNENWRFVYISADFTENPSFVITRIDS